MRLPARKKTIPRTMGPVMASPSTARATRGARMGLKKNTRLPWVALVFSMANMWNT